MAGLREWSLLHLPPEVVEEIILAPVLSLGDICRLRAVSWRMHELVARLWGRIARSRWHCWPTACIAHNQTDWYDLCKQRRLCEVHSHRLLQELTGKGLKLFVAGEDELGCFIELVESGKCSVPILKCVLTEVLQANVKDADLSHQFYALYAMEHVVWKELRGQWEELINLPVEQQHLEKGAVLLAQWMNPCQNIDAEAVSRQLDNIAEAVAVELIKRNGDRGGREDVADPQPAAPKCSKPEGYSSENVARVHQLNLPLDIVLSAINNVLYNDLGFKPKPSEHYYDLDNSYINRVLEEKSGIPITMCVVYQAVASRLGVTLLPVNFPNHFLLKMPDDGIQLGLHEAVFIDAFRRGQRWTAQECLALIGNCVISPETFTACQPIQVFMRMAANIYSSSNALAGHDVERTFNKTTGQWSTVALTSALSLQLALCHLMCTHDPTVSKSRAIYAALMSIEINYSTQMVERVLSDIYAQLVREGVEQDLNMLIQRARAFNEKKEKILATPLEPKDREKGPLSYRIGMIMKHRLYNYRAVIYGWDHKCQMSEGWMLQMGVDRLPRGRNQPFYNVLVEDGSNRYAAEDNVLPCPPRELGPIMHWEVGKYFCRFSGDRYIPNFALKEKYPHDEP